MVVVEGQYWTWVLSHVGAWTSFLPFLYRQRWFTYVFDLVQSPPSVIEFQGFNTSSCECLFVLRVMVFDDPFLSPRTKPVSILDTTSPLQRLSSWHAIIHKYYWVLFRIQNPHFTEFIIIRILNIMNSIEFSIPSFLFFCLRILVILPPLLRLLNAVTSLKHDLSWLGFTTMIMNKLPKHQASHSLILVTSLL